MINNKKAISAIIGYVLLISFAVVISAFVYSWMSSYVPTEELKCPDGISIYIQSATIDSSNLELTIKNNGRFNIAGYFIRGAATLEQKLTTIELSQYLDTSTGSQKLNPGVKLILSGGTEIEDENILNPTQTFSNTFKAIPTIARIEITPFIYKEQDNKKRLVICTESTATKEI